MHYTCLAACKTLASEDELASMRVVLCTGYERCHNTVSLREGATTPADADNHDAPAAPPPLDDASALLGGLGMGFFSMVISQLPLDRVMVV